MSNVDAEVKVLSTMEISRVLENSHKRGKFCNTLSQSNSSLDEISKARAKSMLSYAAEEGDTCTPLGEVLGEGGTARVLSAVQASLGRMVALKVLRESSAVSTADMRSLVREAWVTGTLEHPNIVPIYYIQTDTKSNPQIVFKKIEGLSWSKLMGNSAKVFDLYGEEDLLSWNLSVLQSVIQAVRYAHSRGIIHRDLKPDNVMIGNFGEVYVVDWGIAASVVDDGETLLPLADQLLAEEIVGTPQYMAPEMLGQPLDERCDVYLLGAILYQIISGKVPHTGPEIADFVRSIRASNPIYPENAPKQLKLICQRAMAVDPDDRFLSALELANALSEFDKHKNSMCLSNRANALLVELKLKAEQGEEILTLQGLFGQCRFGFQASLESWPDNRDAKEGQQEAMETFAKVELSQGDPYLAKRLLDELSEPNQSLLEDIKTQIKVLELQAKNKEKIALAMNRQEGRAMRLWFLFPFAFGWLGFEVRAYLTGVRTTSSLSMMIESTLIYLVLLIGLICLIHGSLRTTANRRFVGLFVVILLGQIVVSTLGYFIELESTQVFLMWILIWFLASVMALVMVDVRFWPTSVACVIGFVICSFIIDSHIIVKFLISLVMAWNGWTLWRHLKNESTQPYKR